MTDKRIIAIEVTCCADCPFYCYNHEMTDEQHAELLQIVKESDCKIMISAYENELYNNTLVDWRKEYKSTTAECSRRRTETLYMNY